MATETSRVIKRKRVNLPDGSTVDIPVITQITFLDVVEQGQEYEFHIENSSAANRDVHVAAIPGDGGSTDESGGSSGDGSDSNLKVERIDVWRVLDIVERAQESFIHFDNKTVQEPPDAPPYFTTHEKTHIVKYINTPDDGNWIKSELIDRFKVLDVVEQAQEKEYFLFNPPDNTGIGGLTLDTDADGNPTVAVDPNLPDISDSSNGVDPPWRTDPFQNIVDFSSVLPEVFFQIRVTGLTGSCTVPADTGVSDQDPRPDGPPPALGAGQSFDGSFMSSYSIGITSTAQLFTPQFISGPGPVVSLSRSSFSHGDWEYSLRLGFNVPPPLWMNGMDPGEGHSPATPALVLNGKTIPGFTSALSVTFSNALTPFASGPYTFDDLGIPNNGNWWRFTAGIIPSTGTVPVDSFTVTVSSDPFTFNGTQYKAVGLAADIQVSIPPILAPGTLPGPAATLLIYAIPA